MKKPDMKTLLRDESGIALVTALMLTLVSLTVVMSLMYIITSGTKISAANKRYSTVLQSAYGATDLVSKDIIVKVFEGYSTASRLQSEFTTISTFSVNSCINQKVLRNTNKWDSACQISSFSPKQSPDLSFILQSTSNQPFQVYAKIVETSVGNTENASNANLSDALNVTESTMQSGETKPSSFRIEIQSERSNNPQERAILSVLYAY